MLSKAHTKPAKISSQYLMLAIFLAVVFTTGGSSRYDEPQLVILTPASLIFCAIATLTLRREHFREHRFLLAGWGGVLTLALVHAAPMPSAVGQLLPVGIDINFINDSINAGAQWRPLALVPENAMHALLSLVTPLTVVLLGIQLGPDDRFRLTPLLIGLATISGLIGLLQSMGSPTGPLYLYRITNNGSAVGLLANRNHAATLLACLFPMLAVYASALKGSTNDLRSRQLWCIAIAAVLVPLLLVTGSRSGLLAAIIGLAGAALLYRVPSATITQARQGSQKLAKSPLMLAGLGVLGLGILTLYFSRAVALERLFDQDLGKDGRADFVIVSTDLFLKYFPWGAGSGSFAAAFQMAEPTRFLGFSYVNHAHNDWLETAVTLGVPGVTLVGILMLTYLGLTYRLWRDCNPLRRSVMLGRMASVGIGIIAVASLSDYPLRTPIMMSLMALLTLMLAGAGTKLDLK